VPRTDRALTGSADFGTLAVFRSRDMPLHLLRCLILIVTLAATVTHAAAPAPPGAARCVVAARVFLEGLVPDQRRRAVVGYDHPTRARPLFPPGMAPAATGMRTGELADGQRVRLHDFLSCALSAQGYQKAIAVIRRGDMAREAFAAVPLTQRETRAETSSGHFWITLFGEPSLERPFAWRFEGHHLLLDFRIERGQLVPGPMFLGADPAVMTKGAWAGFRVLDSEFARGLELLESLTAAQRRRAVLGASLPQTLRTTPDAKAPRPAPAGLPANALDPGQQRLLWRLIEEYLGNVEAGLADRLLERLGADGLERLYFAWQGPVVRGQPVYYRVSSPSLDLEFSQALDARAAYKGFDLNHIHTWWRTWPPPDTRPATRPAT
jgi:hypothetical protein